MPRPGLFTVRVVLVVTDRGGTLVLRFSRVASSVFVLAAVLLVGSALLNRPSAAATSPQCTVAQALSPFFRVSVVSVDPSSSLTTGQSAMVTVRLQNLFGRGIAHANLRWQVTGPGAATASPSSGSLSTNVLGRASFSYTNTKAGQDVVQVWYELSGDSALDCGEANTSVTIDWTPGIPTSIVVTPPTATNGVGQTQTETATVTDQYGNPVTDGTTVSWVIEGANASTANPPTGTSTTTGGQATFSYTNTKQGTDTVRAYIDSTPNGVYEAGEVTGTATVTWTPGPPATISVAPPSATNTVGQTHTVTATVTDQYGNTVADGTTIEWVIEGANAASADPANGSSTTTNGQATFSYTNTKTGTDTIRAFFDSNPNGTYNNGEATGTATKTWTPGAVANVTVSPANPSMGVGQTQTETATVTDQYGNNVVDGTTVNWVVEGANSGTASPASGTSTTTNGQATFNYTNAKTGVDTVRAFIDTTPNGNYDSGELNGTATVTWNAGPPATISVAPPSATNTVGLTQTETATVVDQYGNNVADGTTINWVVEGANAGAASPASGTSTTTNGQATFSYTNTTTGTDTVRAFSDSTPNSSFDSGEVNGTATVTWNAGDPVTITVAPPTATNTAGQSHTATATVVDQYGNNVADGTTINWVIEGANSATASPASGTTTTTGGQTTFSYSNAMAGTDTIRAFYDSTPNGTFDTGEPNGTATKTWIAGAAANVSVTPSTASNVVGQTHTATATVTDQYGNVVADGTTVNWVIEGTNAGTASPPSGTSTTTSGQATFSYSNATTGTDTIRAFIDTTPNGTYDSGEPTGTATKSWTVGAPATISVAPASPTNTVGQNQTETATVQDQYGNNVADGTTINWVVEGANAGAASPASGTSTTTNGQATFSYTNTTTGTDTVRAFSDSTPNSSFDSGEVNGTATVNWSAGAPAGITVTPGIATNVVGQTHTVTATVVDQYGNDVVDGTTVNFVIEGINAVTASPASGLGGTTSGQATFFYTNIKPGTDTIRAFFDSTPNGTYDAGEPTGTATKTWTPDVPATITLNPATDTHQVNQTQSETAAVVDQYGNSVGDGTTINWVIEGANAGTANPASTTSTTTNGQTTFSYTNTTPGTDTVRAFYDSTPNGTFDSGEPNGTATITWTYPPPVAANDTYSATGNVEINVPSGSGVLTNDTLNNGTISSVDTTGTQGNVTVNSDGSFTYNPKAGFTGADTFKYTLTNIGGSSTGTVTVNVSNMIWFINNDPAAPAGNDGRLTSPFNSLSSFTTAGGGASGDIVFIYESGHGSYTSGITLKNSQKLIGQGVDLSSNLGFTLAPFSNSLPGVTSNPTITNSSGNGVTLGSGNTVKGVTIGNTSGAGLFGASVGTLTVSTVTINGSGGIADLSSGTLAVTLDAASSSSGASYGLRLNSVSGTFTVSGATSIASPTNEGVLISGSSGLTTTFNGLTITNTGHTGFSASNGGTVVITGTTNTINTTSGTALSLTSTTIGSSGVKFQTISSSGATNGIVLSSTGTGAFTVTGTGIAGSGGTISNITTNGIKISSAQHVSLSYMTLTNANTSDAGSTGVCDANTNSGCNASINLSSVSDVTLDHISISGGVENGINGVNVTKLTLSNSSITNVGDAVNEYGIEIYGLFGTQSASTANSISNTTVSGSYDSNLFIRNSTATNAYPGAPDRLAVSNSTFSSSDTNEGLTISSRLTANFQLALTSSTFTNNPTVGVHVDAGDTSHNDFSMSGSSVSGSTTGVDVSGSGTAATTFNVSNNNGAGISVLTGSGIVIASNSSSTMDGSILSNKVTTTVANNPAYGIDVLVDQTGTATVKVDSNNVTNFMTGIRGGARNAGTGHADLTVTNNTVDNTANTAPYMGMWFFSGNGSAGESNVVCLHLSGNSITFGGAGNYGVELDQDTGTTFNIQGLTPATGATEAQVESYVSGQNNGTSVIAAGGTVINYTAGNCALP